MSRPHLFMDSDGVFAHFDQNVLNRFGVLPSGMNDDEMWRRINAEPNFWPEMPLMPGAERLWAAIKHVEPTILTGCPKSDYERSVEHKMSWWANGHFAHEKVITCLSKDKALHMKQPGDWLVDDMSKNCKRWEKAGGRAYRYDGDVDKCVAFLKAHGVI